MQSYKLLVLGILIIMTYQQPTQAQNTNDMKTSTIKAENDSKDVICKLTTPELQERRATVLENLKKQVISSREVENGYAFKFEGKDKILNQLLEFIKTERECCAFFVFNLSIAGDKGEIWFELTGPEGTKEFIASTMGI